MRTKPRNPTILPSRPFLDPYHCFLLILCERHPQPSVPFDRRDVLFVHETCPTQERKKGRLSPSRQEPLGQISIEGVSLARGRIARFSLGVGYVPWFAFLILSYIKDAMRQRKHERTLRQF